MFEARLNQGVLLKRIFEAVKELAQEVNIEVASGGLELQAMDAAQVSLVRLDMKPSAFDTYRCDNPRSLGLNMNTVVKVMKMCNNEDSVTIKHDDNDDHLTFVFENPRESKTAAFKMKLMMIDDERMAVPETDYTATVDIASRIYAREVAQLATFSDKITIEVTKDGTLSLVASGDDGTAQSSFSPSPSDDEIRIAAKESVSCSFGARHLAIFAKAVPISSNMRLCLSDGNPLLLTMDLSDDPNTGSMLFFLAPKLEDSAMIE